MKKLFEIYCRNVTKYRKQKNLSCYELSLRIYKNESYISKLENGKVNISLNSMIDIAECLETPLEDFFK